MIQRALHLTLFPQANGSKASAVQKQKTAWKSDDSAGEQRTTDALQVLGQHLPTAFLHAPSPSLAQAYIADKRVESLLSGLASSLLASMPEDV